MSLRAPASLRGRLLLFLLLAIALFAVAQGLGAYRQALRDADLMFDHQLRQIAHSLRGGNLLPPTTGMDEEDLDLLIQIWGADGARIFRSPRSRLPQTAVLGFSDVRVEGRHFRVYTVQTPLHTVQIAQDMSERDARARALAARAVLPVALMAPLLMLVVWWVVSRALAPVQRLREQVAARSANELSALPADGLPEEVQPLVADINNLLARLGESIEQQRHFVADAAHELRSPLTALKLQAQALRAPPAGDGDAALSPHEREAAVQRLNQGIDRAVRLVEQLLALARAEQGATPGAPPGAGSGAARTELRAHIAEVIAELLPLAQARGIDLGVAPEPRDAEPAAPRWVHGDPDAWRSLLRNLVDNAIKYTPAPGQVDVGLRVDGADIVLTVDDSGPGIAPDERERVFDRFWRAGGQAGAVVGSGLGLAIVRASAQRNGAQVRLGEAPGLGGLRVEVRAPAA